MFNITNIDAYIEREMINEKCGGDAGGYYEPDDPITGFTEVYGNFWDLIKGYNVACITTNLAIKNNGEGVMGRGIALEAKNKIPGIAKRLGDCNRKAEGKIMPLAKIGDTVLVNFTVKYSWEQKAVGKLIKQSALQLKELAEKHPDKKFLLPRPGVGNGKLDWETQVKPLLISLALPGNIHIVTFK